MSTRPAPDFALSFSNDAVHLLERDDGGVPDTPRWLERGAAAFGAPDFRDAMSRLRDIAANGAEAPVALIIPDDQILYTTLPVGRPADPQSAVGAALDGLTPYKVDDLAWDWRPEAAGEAVRVAAVARQTLREAEEFAERYGFSAASFVADPADELFPAAPCFDPQSEAEVAADGAADAAAAAAATEDAPAEGAADAPVAEPATEDATEAEAPADSAQPGDASSRTDAPADDDSSEAAADAGSSAGHSPAEMPSEEQASVTPSGNPVPVDEAPGNEAGTDELGDRRRAEDQEPDEGDGSEAGGGDSQTSGVAAEPEQAGESFGQAQPAAAGPAPQVTGGESHAHADATASPAENDLQADRPATGGQPRLAAPAYPHPARRPGNPAAPLVAPAAGVAVPLNDRARALRERTAEARGQRRIVAEPAPARRHPGARGGTGALVVMLGALLVGLLLVWAFVSPEATPDRTIAATVTEVPGEPTPTPAASAPASAIPEDTTEPEEAALAASAPASAILEDTREPEEAATAAAGGPREGAGEAAAAAGPAAATPPAASAAPTQAASAAAQTEPSAPASSAALAEAAPAGVGTAGSDSPPVAVPAPVGPAPASSASQGSAEPPATLAGDASSTPAAGAASGQTAQQTAITSALEEAAAAPTAAPSTAPILKADPATGAAGAPATEQTATSSGQAPAASEAARASVGGPARAEPAATARTIPSSRSSAPPRRPAPAVQPAPAQADPPPSLPSRSAGDAASVAGNVSARPAPPPRRPVPRAAAAEATGTPARVAPAASAPAPAVRPAPPPSRPRAESGSTTRSVAPPPAAAPAASRPPSRPATLDQGSADDSLTAAEMTAEERWQADLLLADLYIRHPQLPRFAAPRTLDGPRYAENRPARRPGTAIDAAAVELAVKSAAASVASSSTAGKPVAKSASLADVRPAAVAAAAAAAPAAGRPGRPAPRPARGGVASAAAVEMAIAEAVTRSNATPGGIELAALRSSPLPVRKPGRDGTAAAAPDAEAEAVAAAAAAAVAAAPVAPVAAVPAPTPPAVAAVSPESEARKRMDEQLQAQAEARARAQAEADARAEQEARAQAEARARAQAAAEERAAIASRGEYKPPEIDDEPEVTATAPRGPVSTDVARNATVGGMDLGKTQVIGVIGAGRASRGLIRLRNGKIVTVRLGDKIDGGAINAIGNGRITYVKGGRPHHLAILNGR